MSYAYKSRLVRFIACFIDFIGSILFFWIKKNQAIDKKGIKRILVVKLDHLGDSFILTPLFEYLAKEFPTAKIDIICLELTKPVFENNPHIRKVIAFNYFRTWRENGKRAGFKDTLQLIKDLKKERYDLFIDARGEPFASLLGFLIGARYRIGFGREEVGGFLYTNPLNYNSEKHESEKNKVILKALDIEVREWHPEVYIGENEKSKMENLLKENFSKPIAAIHIGAGLPHKIWPVENFTELISTLLKRYDYEFILLGGKDDNILVQNLIGFLKPDIKLKDFTGRLTIREVYYLLSKANIFIGSDSVFAHFAGALGIPAIEIMNGAINKNRWTALGEGVCVVTGFDGNHKCLLDKCKYPCPHMSIVTVKEVFDAVEKVINLQEIWTKF